MTDKFVPTKPGWYWGRSTSGELFAEKVERGADGQLWVLDYENPYRADEPCPGAEPWVGPVIPPSLVQEMREVLDEMDRYSMEEVGYPGSPMEVKIRSILDKLKELDI